MFTYYLLHIYLYVIGFLIIIKRLIILNDIEIGEYCS